MLDFADKTLKNDLYSKTSTKSDLDNPCRFGKPFFPIFYHNDGINSEKGEFNLLDDYLEKIQTATNYFTSKLVDLLSSENDKFGYSYTIKIYNKKDCEPLEVYPRYLYEEIFRASINENFNTPILQKEKIFETTFKFLEKFLQIFKNDINVFEIQFHHHINFTETVKLFKNDKYEVEKLVYEYLKSLKEIISNIEYESANKKGNNTEKERVLNYLNAGLDLIQCKINKKSLEDGERDEPCDRIFQLLIEEQNKEFKNKTEKVHVQENKTSFVENKQLQGESTPLGTKTAKNLNIPGNEYLHVANNSNSNGNLEIDQSFNYPNIFIFLGCVSFVFSSVFLFFYIINYFVKRWKNKQNEETELVILV